jgi:anti-sigma-K factor RskA
MNLLNNPGLLDKLAAAYALGTLRGGARRRFEAQARQSATVRAAALIWQERFASMTELQLTEAPSANVWKRIENMLRSQEQPAAMQESPMLENLRRMLGWWRGAALAGGLATVAVAVVSLNLSREVDSGAVQLAQAAQQRAQLTQQNAQLAQRLAATPQIQYVAVLADDKSAASILVTFDPAHSVMTLKHMHGLHLAADKSLQLWALPPGAGPKSLGIVEGGTVVRLQAAESQVREIPALAVSLEPKGGVPEGSGPSGPVLFKGALLQTPI